MRFTSNLYWFMAAVVFGFLSCFLLIYYFSSTQEETTATGFALPAIETVNAPTLNSPVDISETLKPAISKEQDLSIQFINNIDSEAPIHIQAGNPNAPGTVGEFIDVEQVLAAESKKPPRTVGKFIDVNQYLKPDRASTSNEVIESGQFKDVNQFHPKTSNEVIDIGEKMDIESGMIPDSQSRVINIGEFIPVKD